MADERRIFELIFIILPTQKLINVEIVGPIMVEMLHLFTYEK